MSTSAALRRGVRIPALGVAALLASAIATEVRAGGYVFSQIPIPGAVGGPINPSLTGDEAQALSINGKGHVLVSVLSYQPAEPYPDNVDFNAIYNIHTHAFSALPNDPLAVAGSTLANGINNSGEIVGQYDAGGGALRGFSYAHGAFKTLDPFGSPYSFAVAVSNNGQVTGGAFTFDVQGNIATGQAYLLSHGVYALADALPPAGNVNVGRGVDNAGVVAGYDQSGSTGASGNYLDASGTIMPITIAGSIYSEVAQENDRGVVVGLTTSDPTFASYNGFVDNNGAVSLLSFPGSAQTFIEGVNNGGDIVGQYQASDGSYQAFVATATPEPATWAMLLTGFIGLGGRLRARRRASTNSSLQQGETT